MKTTYKNVFQFTHAAAAYLNENKKETKLKIQLEKVVPSCQEAIKKYYDALSDLELEHAAIDKDGCVLYTATSNGREYKYTKEGLKARDNAIKQLFEEGETEIQENICKQIPPGLHADFKTVFKGFVI